MPVDSSIYFQQQTPDIVGSIQKGLSMRDMLDQKKKAKGLEDAYKAGVIKNPDGTTTVDTSKTVSALAGLDPKAAMELQNQSAKQKMDQQEFDWKKQANDMGVIAQAFGSAVDQNTWGQTKNNLQSKGYDVSDVPDLFDPKTQQFIVGKAVSVKDRIDQQWKQKEYEQKDKEIAIKDKLAGIKASEKKAGDKAMTVAQAKQMGLYQQGEEAEKQFQAATSGKGMKRFDPSSNFQWVDKNDWAPQFLKSDESIRAHSAQDRWIEAYLRDASGAAIPPSERGAYAKDFFPMAGDSKQVVADKAKARQVKMQAAKMGATGRAEAPAFDASKLAQAPDSDIDELYRKLGGE